MVQVLNRCFCLVTSTVDSMIFSIYIEINRKNGKHFVKQIFHKEGDDFLSFNGLDYNCPLSD